MHALSVFLKTANIILVLLLYSGTMEKAHLRIFREVSKKRHPCFGKHKNFHFFFAGQEGFQNFLGNICDITWKSIKLLGLQERKGKSANVSVSLGLVILNS